MPALSKKQRRAMAIALHHPEELYARNKAMAEMSKEDLEDFASTKEKGLPEKVKARKKRKKRRPLRKGEFRRGGYNWRDYED